MNDAVDLRANGRKRCGSSSSIAAQTLLEASCLVPAPGKTVETPKRELILGDRADHDASAHNLGKRRSQPGVDVRPTMQELA